MQHFQVDRFQKVKATIYNAFLAEKVRDYSLQLKLIYSIIDILQ